MVQKMAVPQHNDVVRLAAEQAAEAYDRQFLKDPANAALGRQRTYGLFTAAQFGQRLCKFAGVKRKLLPPELVRVILAGRSDITLVDLSLESGLYKVLR